MTELMPEDYKEPRCLTCEDFYNPEEGEDRNITTIPIDRMIDKLDDYFSRNDMEGAKRHLEYWLEEARGGRDKRGELAVLNELLGLYRKMGLKEKAFKAVEESEAMLKRLNMEDSLTAGTVNLNIATVCEAFEKCDEALMRYERALKVYEKYLDKNDSRFGGLYNNMALALVSLNRYAEAKTYYEKAIDVMMNIPHGYPEAAITYLNLANCEENENGLESAEDDISAYLTKAEELLYNEDNLFDGNYAFVCSKCAPTFRYYGWFLTANELERRSEEIYEGN